MFFVLSRAWDKENILTKNIFPYFFTELKTFHLSNSDVDAVGIADPSSMQDACNTNFVIDHADRRVSLAQW